VRLMMPASEVAPRPLSPERSLYMQRAAAQALEALRRFSGERVEYGATSLQLLDEWIERLVRKGPLSAAARALVIAFLGHVFVHMHGGCWATLMKDQRQQLGVICPVAGVGDRMRFINIVDQVNERLDQGIRASLAFFYLTTSVDLRGHSWSST
jgi:hypothetical protein